MNNCDSDFANLSSDDLAHKCAEQLSALKASDILSICVRDKSSVTDFMLVCTGTSNRHVCAIADRLVELLKQHGLSDLKTTGAELGQWVIVDCGNVVVHVLQPEYRELYKLEDLYRMMAAGIAPSLQEEVVG